MQYDRNAKDAVGSQKRDIFRWEGYTGMAS